MVLQAVFKAGWAHFSLRAFRTFDFRMHMEWPLSVDAKGKRQDKSQAGEDEWVEVFERGSCWDFLCTSVMRVNWVRLRWKKGGAKDGAGIGCLTHVLWPWKFFSQCIWELLLLKTFRRPVNTHNASHAVWQVVNFASVNRRSRVRIDVKCNTVKSERTKWNTYRYMYAATDTGHDWCLLGELLKSWRKVY